MADRAGKRKPGLTHLSSHLRRPTRTDRMTLAFAPERIEH
jgi:hypothetical protein